MVFLQAVMGNPVVETQLRLKAAEALIPYHYKKLELMGTIH
jgi:hypothetical protein